MQLIKKGKKKRSRLHDGKGIFSRKFIRYIYLTIRINNNTNDNLIINRTFIDNVSFDRFESTRRSTFIVPSRDL